MIDQDCRARLADFGLLTIVSDSTNPTASNSSTGAGTTRWMSPELLDLDRFGFEHGRSTKESDCYALGMVILEVTGRVPFAHYKDFIVAGKVIDGERPERPRGPEAVWFTDDVWETLEQCWLPQPEARPTAKIVLERLEQGSAAWQSLFLGADGEFQADSDDESVLTVSDRYCMFLYFVLNSHSLANTLCTNSNSSTGRRQIPSSITQSPS